jgi:uncharacterized protein YjcR
MVQAPTIDPTAATPPIPFEAKRAARSLYWRGWAIQQIAEELGLAYTTVSSWKSRHKWDDATTAEKGSDAVLARYNTLIAKEDKSGKDFKEIDLLGRQLAQMARVERYSATGRESDLNPKLEGRQTPEVKERRAATKQEKRKNYLTDEQWELLEDDFHTNNVAHQKLWWDNRDQGQRKIKKSRQIGATWYFAREAVMKARESSLDGEPRNQIFLSASKRQALIFRRYIVAWVRKVTGVELKGGLQDAPMLLDMGEGSEAIELHFLSTNKSTAQGEHGDVYIDEFFWIPGFKELKRVASAMATHSHYKVTYFSSASAVTHEAYPFWNGDEWNEGRNREDRREFDVSIAALASGKIMPDGSWQHVVTIQQAIAGGMGKWLNEAKLRQTYSEEEFRNLFECEEIDDTASSFPFSMLNPCRVDSFYKWKDFKPAEARPFGANPAWIGYDPDKGGRDGAALAILAPPEKQGGKFRLLEKIGLKGLDFEAQNQAIKRVAGRYNIQDIGMDTSGAGDAVYQLVKLWFPNVRRVDYSVSTKSALVLKAQNVMRRGRFEYDSGWHDVSSALMSIRPTLTKGGKQVTYASGRTAAHGHADIAWAILNALINEPLDVSEASQSQSSVEFFE